MLLAMVLLLSGCYTQAPPHQTPVPDTCCPSFSLRWRVDSGAKRACQHGRLARRCDIEEFMRSLFISWFDYRINEDLMSVYVLAGLANF